MRPSRVVAFALALTLPVLAAPSARADAAPAPDPASFGLVGAYLAGRAAARTPDQALAAAFYARAGALDPDEPELKARRLLALIEDGAVDLAMPLARALDGVETLPPVVPGLVQLLIALDDMKADRWAAADKRLADLPRTNLTVVSVPLLRGWAAAGAGQDPASRFKPLIDAAPLHTDLHAALIAESKGDRAAAGVIFDKLIAAQTPPSFRLVELAGAHYERGGQRPKAIALYKSFAAGSSDPDLIASALARAEGGRPAPRPPSLTQGAAMALFDAASTLPRERAAVEIGLMFNRLALWLDPDLSIAQLVTGDQLEQLGRSAAAIGLWTRIAPDSPHRWAAQIRAAAANNDLDDPEAALAGLKALAAAHPKREEPLIRMADLLRQRERFAEAIPHYDAAIARIGTIQKRHWNLLFSRAIVLERTGAWERAEADLKKALEFEPNQPFLLNYLGYTWADKGINLAEAEAMLRKAVAAAPRDGHIADSLGWALYRLGRYAEAEEYLERASELAPSEGVIIDHLGDVYWMVGRRREAQFQWQRALTLKIDADVRAAVLRKLESGLPEPAAPQRP